MTIKLPKSKPPTEKQVQQQVKRLLHHLGFIVSDLSQPRASMQTAGLPDLYCQHRRLKACFWVEVKRPGGKVSDNQQAWHENEHESGGTVYVVHSASEMADILSEKHELQIR